MTYSENYDEQSGNWGFAGIMPVAATFGLEEEQKQLILVLSVAREQVLELLDYTDDKELKVVLPVEPDEIDSWLEALNAYKDCLNDKEPEAPQ
ncbi:hypothetical protein SEA_GUEY18_93 [Gordonia phage Guey18]|uniref:Uncharacterized protein n=1 Tax=Gordonia phage Ziko TaxID=2591193 RepID=A0A514A582_9CAUD|nr:hypothetical protein SEA_ZIKO_91 [Gordonia phage Ziko]QTF81878.1 hypothetical protein SEA_GUEY18_93 [Gordonia phage Guey18]